MRRLGVRKRYNKRIYKIVLKKGGGVDWLVGLLLFYYYFSGRVEGYWQRENAHSFFWVVEKCRRILSSVYPLFCVSTYFFLLCLLYLLSFSFSLSPLFSVIFLAYVLTIARLVGWMIACFEYEYPSSSFLWLPFSLSFSLSLNDNTTIQKY